MTKLTIKRSSDKNFPTHQPMSLYYFMGFKSKSDHLIYDIASFEYEDFDRKETFTFEAEPMDGDAFKFEGYLHSVTPGKESRQMRLMFVSKYSLILNSMPPMFGKGNVTDLLKGLYAKVGVAVSSADSSETAMENFLMGRDKTLQQGIEFLLDRAPAADSGYLCSTIVGDNAYIRNVKKGKQDIKGLYYVIHEVTDQRKAIDLEGGLKVSVISDSKKQQKVDLAFPGAPEVPRNAFLTHEDTEMNRAKARVIQARLFYSNYVAIISMPGWMSFLGSNLVVDKDDILAAGDGARKQLLMGTYFINSSVLEVDFSKRLEITRFGIQRTGN